MQVLEGQLPTSTMWRVIVLLSPQEGVTLAWELGLLLARANRGALVACVVVDKTDGGEVDDQTILEAQETLHTVKDICAPNDQIEELIVTIEHPKKGLKRLIESTQSDLLIIDFDAPVWRSVNNLPCTVAVLRLSNESKDKVRAQGIQRILVPTAGGPHTAQAFRLLRHIDERVDIDALFISRAAQGYHEEALGYSRLERILKFADAESRVDKRVVRADDAASGIVKTASEDYDLVILGATGESTVDRAIFGDIVSAVVRESGTPVLVIRLPDSRGERLLNLLDWRLQKLIPRMSPEERRDVYVRIREGANPDLDYRVLITLSAAVAAFGLILDSPAVVIGAMLIAPLMAPIVALGMAFVLGDIRFMRRTLGSGIQGALTAIFVGLLIGLLPGDNMTPEVMGRTQPSLVDLGVALFSGLAGAFAMVHTPAAAALPGVAIAAALVPPLGSVGIAFAEGEWPQGLGALLLFITNYVTISSASAVVFMVFGFRPNPTAKAELRIQQRSSQIAIFSLALVAVLLSVTTARLTRVQQRRATIEQVLNDEVTNVIGTQARIDAIIPENPDLPAAIEDPLSVTLMVAAPHEPTSDELRLLQQSILVELQQRVNMENDLEIRYIHLPVCTIRSTAFASELCPPIEPSISTP